MLNRIFVVDSVTLTSTGAAVSSYVPWDQSTRKLPTQVVIKATGQGAYVRLSNDNSAATNADTLVQAGDHVVLSVQGRRWVSVLSDGASSTVNVGALSTGVSGSAASLELAFVDAGVLDPRVTFTRASTATYFDSTGTLQSASNNVPRFDYNPATLAAQGLLIEEQRTNSIRNNTMQGAVAGTPGTLPTNWSSTLQGLSQTIVGTGTTNGISYIDIRFFGTTTSASAVGITFEPQGVIACSNGQTWAASLWISLISGSFTGVTSRGFSANIFDSGGAYLSDLSLGGLSTVTATFQRVTPTAGTISQVGAASLRPYIFFSHAGIGTSLDFTLRIGLPQLEQGAFATSVIPTTTTALTRSADVASVNTLAPWFNASAGTLYAEGITSRPYTAATGGQMAQISDGTANNRMWIAQGNTTANTATNSVVTTSTVLVAELQYGPTPSANLVNKSAFAYAANDFAGCSNGGTVQTDTSGAVPSVTTLYLGVSATLSSASNWNGYLRRITYYPRRLSNAELQAITA